MTTERTITVYRWCVVSDGVVFQLHYYYPTSDVSFRQINYKQPTLGLDGVE